MAKDFAKSFYKSKQWRVCRDAYYESQFGICERCGRACWRRNDPQYLKLRKEGKEVYYGIVHHIEELNPRNISNPFVSLGWNNLELLCQDCHNKHHNSSKEAIPNDVFFDENGRLTKKKSSI
ncbi:hypothetical protein AOC36_09585 [Erysipelothrix larvae]|uniref:HNH domain-containing protein n=1 Tax=Erysipelothrix larvae TaxID=1514105 RepID=A0A0X8H173_9FIRM|nr:HNH endonuclease [Erysipelothrix larvae]AMC94224.1 hypothetical protein AOC36_09585 [Erysipelothrix larvae]